MCEKALNSRFIIGRVKIMGKKTVSHNNMSLEAQQNKLKQNEKQPIQLIKEYSVILVNDLPFSCPQCSNKLHVWWDSYKLFSGEFKKMALKKCDYCNVNYLLENNYKDIAELPFGIVKEKKAHTNAAQYKEGEIVSMNGRYLVFSGCFGKESIKKCDEKNVVYRSTCASDFDKRLDELYAHVSIIIPKDKLKNGDFSCQDGNNFILKHKSLAYGFHFFEYSFSVLEQKVLALANGTSKDSMIKYQKDGIIYFIELAYEGYYANVPEKNNGIDVAKNLEGWRVTHPVLGSCKY